jgi:hypothetical protein
MAGRFFFIVSCGMGACCVIKDSGSRLNPVLAAATGHSMICPMSRLWLGCLAGLVYGALSAASMLPLSFQDKRAALTGAFLNRLASGVMIGVVTEHWGR